MGVCRIARQRGPQLRFDRPKPITSTTPVFSFADEARRLPAGLLPMNALSSQPLLSAVRRWCGPRGLCCGLLGLAAAAPAWAVQDLTAMSLEQLMDMPVTAASKYAQPQHEVAASVSVITREDIRTFGWRTLGEALASLPGFYTTYDRQYTYIGARGLGIPPVLVQGDVAGINDIITHWLTTGIDPLAAQISKEFSRKLIPKADWLRGDRVYADTSTIQHFDMFSNAANIEKIVESAAYSINELREATGGAPLPDEWANIHWMTKNIATVETVARDAATESNPKEE